MFHSYFLNQKRRVKIGSGIRRWIDILTGIPQGSILDPLIFNVFIKDLIMFIEKTDICNFADDNTLYKSCLSLSVVINCLVHGITIVSNWFKVSSLKANPPKFQFMVLGGKKVSETSATLRAPIFFSKNKAFLLGTTIDNKLTFKAHTENLCKKASYNLWYGPYKE